MAIFNSCSCRTSCTLWALIAGVILGVIAAFLQITGAITVTTAFVWVAFGIGLAFLGILTATAAVRPTGLQDCCDGLNALLAGALGSVLLAVILLAAGIVATSVVSAIAVGLLVFFLSLTLGASACYVRCVLGCGGPQ